MTTGTGYSKEQLADLKGYIEIDHYDKWVYFQHCFPQNKDGLYCVHKEINGPAEYVKAEKIVKYNWIAINTWLVTIEPYSGLEIESEEYDGVNNQGIALIVLEFESDTFKKDMLQSEPTFICKHNHIIHCIYKLKDFIPKETSSDETKGFLGMAVLYLQASTGGKYVHGRPILNPFSPYNEIIEPPKIIEYTIGTLKSDCKKNGAFAKSWKKGLSQKLSEAAKKGHMPTTTKNKADIIDALNKLILLGTARTKNNVALLTELSPKTIQRYKRDYPEIQKLFAL